MTCSKLAQLKKEGKPMPTSMDEVSLKWAVVARFADFSSPDPAPNPHPPCCGTMQLAGEQAPWHAGSAAVACVVCPPSPGKRAQQECLLRRAC